MGVLMVDVFACMCSAAGALHRSCRGLVYTRALHRFGLQGKDEEKGTQGAFPFLAGRGLRD